MERCCRTCQWWESDPYIWVCCNDKSEHCADFTGPEDTCPCWENYKVNAAAGGREGPLGGDEEMWGHGKDGPVR